jgi:serine/threonine protein kinase
VIRPQVRPLRVLGRYALYEPIASGGMATVHLGRLLGPVGFARTVAIKRLHENFARDPEFVAMFMDEARLAARIQHPNVVDMLDVIVTDGELFLVLGYVHGESLATLLRTARERGERVPLGVAGGVAVGVLQGLQAAHEAKNERGEPLDIVHRDVSPHNILVGVDGVPRLIDFGVAKAAGRMQKSHSGQIKGKLAYMAPEQTTGDADSRSDVYAASVILWEAIAGKRLFSGDNDAMLLREVLQGRVDPPSLYAHDVPRELDALILRGLAAEPSGRFATAREMARELERIVPVASASIIGEWVDSLKHASLLERASRVETVEQSSSSLTEQPLPRPRRAGADDEGARSRASHEEATRSLPADKAAPGRDPDQMPTQLSSTSPSEPRRSRLGRGRSMALYGAVFLAALGAWAVARRSVRPAPATLAAAQDDVRAETPAPASSVLAPAPETLAPATPLADAKAPVTPASATRRAAPRPTQASPSTGRAARDLERAIDNRK